MPAISSFRKLIIEAFCNIQDWTLELVYQPDHVQSMHEIHNFEMESANRCLVCSELCCSRHAAVPGPALKMLWLQAAALSKQLLRES